MAENKRSILIIDDNPSILRTMTYTFICLTSIKKKRLKFLHTQLYTL